VGNDYNIWNFIYPGFGAYSSYLFIFALFFTSMVFMNVDKGQNRKISDEDSYARAFPFNS